MVKPNRCLTRYFDSNGVQIRYTVEGQGEPVILIHGFIASIETNWALPGAIRALAVGRSMPPAMLANFVEIFGKGFTIQKNFLACDFAKPPRKLPEKVEDALSAATI